MSLNTFGSVYLSWLVVTDISVHAVVIALHGINFKEESETSDNKTMNE